MDKKDLIAHSPVRYFDVTNAGLKDGEMGLITAKKGLGKTSILVQFGISTTKLSYTFLLTSSLQM